MIDEWRSERARTLELEQGSDRRGGGAVSQTHALNLTIRLRTNKKRLCVAPRSHHAALQSAQGSSELPLSELPGNTREPNTTEQRPNPTCAALKKKVVDACSPSILSSGRLDPPKGRIIMRVL
ncbi:uncharacterized protein CLUP02_14338 [Colletotrichum lupini]|uniref:Uncharacterized protein n=1 Tax=Colletotrichum lupini TaxID=145971 RepID=A0A9Q8T436_9PEZI|nr:uncharacterized protein CLUP02_14338 [Colletotrichum lupini]UQC88813.1 hypothetical protein CLUP02_14338 [Colletotrichum lupini]